MGRAVVPSCRRAVVPSCRSRLWYFLSPLDGASVREAHCAQASNSKYIDEKSTTIGTNKLFYSYEACSQSLSTWYLAAILNLKWPAHLFVTCHISENMYDRTSKIGTHITPYVVHINHYQQLMPCYQGHMSPQLDMLNK